MSSGTKGIQDCLPRDRGMGIGGGVYGDEGGGELSREGVENSRSQQPLGGVDGCLSDDLFVDRVSFSAGRCARHTFALRQVTDEDEMRKRWLPL